MKFIVIHYHGFILTALGFTIRYIIGRRRFNRRGITGLQVFSSYENWWLTTRLESLFSLLALLAILAGLFLLIFQ